MSLTKSNITTLNIKCEHCIKVKSCTLPKEGCDDLKMGIKTVLRAFDTFDKKIRKSIMDTINTELVPSDDPNYVFTPKSIKHVHQKIGEILFENGSEPELIVAFTKTLVGNHILGIILGVE